MKHKRKKHYRRNPPVRNIVSNIGGQVKPALIGAAAIAVNKFLSNQIASLAKIDATKKNFVEIASAIFLLPLLGKLTKQPMITEGARVAAAVAIFDFVKPQLPATIQAQISGYNFPTDLERVPNMTPARPYVFVDPGISFLPEFNF